MPELEVVNTLDLNRYLGKWYEIASIPQSFSKNCTATIAEYSLKENGDVDVLNTCHKFTVDGKVSTAHGHAWVVDKKVPSKLRVQFFWPFYGDYWVIELGENYEYAVVGHPSREYLWILSRTPQMDEKLVDEIMMRLKDKGYDLLKIERTPQS